MTNTEEQLINQAEVFSVLSILWNMTLMHYRWQNYNYTSCNEITVSTVISGHFSWEMEQIQYPAQI